MENRTVSGVPKTDAKGATLNVSIKWDKTTGNPIQDVSDIGGYLKKTFHGLRTFVFGDKPMRIFYAKFLELQGRSTEIFSGQMPQSDIDAIESLTGARLEWFAPGLADDSIYIITKDGVIPFVVC